MEPQLFSGGNIPHLVDLRHFSLLQWSRSFSAAEIRYAGILGAHCKLLQWSRSFSAAEILDFRGHVCRRRYASMEPQLFSRGNGPRPDRACVRRYASMEPQLFSRGNICASRHVL